MLATTITLVGVLVAPAGAQALPLHSCKRLAGTGFRCGKLTVPLDYAGAQPGTLALDVRVLRASGNKRGTLVMLSGGPGQSDIAGPEFPEYLSGLAPGWQIVEIDQRGTGANALTCPSIDRLDIDVQDVPAAKVTAGFAGCAAELGAKRRFYTSIDSARDIDRLRSGLGLERIAIGGISYGTFVSQVYARLFPDRTERMLIDSVVPPAGVDLLDPLGFDAARRVLAGQCASNRCPGITNDLGALTAKLQTRLGQSPLVGKLVNSSGRPRPAQLGGPAFPTALFDIYAAGDLDLFLRAQYPAAVGAGLDGDAAPLLRLRRAGASRSKPSEFSNTLFAATTCAEDSFPWQGTQSFADRAASLQGALNARPESAFAPWGKSAAGQAVELNGCVQWPDAPFSAVPAQPLPDVPALLLSGRQDIRTPVEDATEVAKLLPHGTLVTVPNAGHSLIGNTNCTEAAIRRFMSNRPIGTPCLREKPYAFSTGAVPASIGQLISSGGAGGRAGRTISAVRLTILDAAATAEMFYDSRRFPGLRRGFGSLSGDGSSVKVRRYSYVRGVELSGRVGADNAVLKVGGSAAAKGELRLRRHRYVGRLGGKRVSFGG